MKSLLKIFFSICFLNILAGCKKDDADNAKNYSLLDKNIDQIRANIKGNWQVQRITSVICEIAGCDNNDFTYPPGKGDLISFLSNDTVKQTKFDNSQTLLYTKAEINTIENKWYLPGPKFIYQYSMNNDNILWIMREFKNDTLIIDEGNKAIAGAAYYLTRR